MDFGKWTEEIQDLKVNFEKVTGQRPSPFHYDCFSIESYIEYLKHCDVNEKHISWKYDEDFLNALEEYEKTLDNNK